MCMTSKDTPNEKSHASSCGTAPRSTQHKERENKRKDEKERRERKTERRIPSYGNNIQGHVGRKELCLQLWFSTQERTAKGKRGRKKEAGGEQEKQEGRERKKERCSQLRPCVQGHTKKKALPATTTHPGTRWRRKLLRPVAQKKAQWFLRNLLIGPWGLLVDDRTSSHGSMNLLFCFVSLVLVTKGDSGYSITLTALRLGAGSLA